jgi:hypothetical protein
MEHHMPGLHFGRLPKPQREFGMASVSLLRANISLHSLLGLGTEIETDYDASQGPELLWDFPAYEEQTDD